MPSKEAKAAYYKAYDAYVVSMDAAKTEYDKAKAAAQSDYDKAYSKARAAYDIAYATYAKENDNDAE